MREDWIEVELGEVFNITYGKGLPTSKLTKEGFPVFGANGIIGYYTEYKYEEKQVLISCRGAASGKINISPEKCFITNNSLIVESSGDFISKEYLYFILSGANRSKIVTGSAQPQVTINNANPLIIKLAPLPIQRAIVSKIEALFSDLDNGIANFKKAQEQLKIYRQAVLKKAFEGGFTNKNVEDGELPKGWKWVKFEDVLEIISGKNQKQVENPNGKYPIYGSGGIFGKADDYLCDAGTTIIGRKGTIDTPIYVNEKFWNVDTAFGLSPLEVLNNKYLFYFCQGFNFKKLDKSTTIPSLAKRDLLKIDIPLPTLAEQTQIVQEIEFRLSVCDKMEQSLKESIEKAEALRQSILKKAFEGRLLSVAEIAQCKKAADYEPASELLKKIKAEKVKTHDRASQQKKPTVKKKSKE